MATGKMFVNYSGTKEAFIAAGLPSQYNYKIVFIKGGEDGKGACVYTHGAYYANVEEAIASLKYFSKISAGGVTAEAGVANEAINFTADDPASVAVKVDSKGVHIALTDEFKAAVNTELPNRISTIEGDYLKGSDKTELEGKVNTALAEAKKYTDDEVSRIVADSGSGLIGSAEDASSANTIYGAKKYADEKAAAAQSAAETTAAADATSKVNAAKTEIKGTTDALDARIKAVEDDYLTSEDLEAINGAASALEGRVKANEDAIGVLNGEGEGSVKKAVDDAINKFATDVTDDQVVNSYKELIDYAAEHGAEFTALVGEVSANKTAAETGISEAKAAAKAADDKAVAAQGTADANAERLTAIEGDYLKGADKEALQGEIDDAEGRLGTIEGDYLKGADKEALQGEIDDAEGRLGTIEGDYLKGADKTELQGNIDAVSAVANAAAPQATTYTKEEVDAMWAWEEL